ncbi:glycosyltransferase [Methanocella arvoryzae]|uniref:glycosyltransferase n=1 Tax=Methanocella arvoryzae TaxID=1175445 RepID=UPI0011D1B024|nr:glycosyltransferase family 2 protein [Methanocella arvoryzae]
MKNKLAFVLVLLMLLALGVLAGSLVYSTILLASVVNWVLVREWIPLASYTLLGIVVVITIYFAARFVEQSRMYRLPEASVRNPLPMTIIIPTLNEERTIGQCVESIMKANYPHDRLEVIIAPEVRPRCRDSTPEIAAALSRKYPCVKVVPNEGPHAGSKAGSINNSLTHATGQIIAIYDADHTIDKDALIRASAEFIMDPKLDCIGGKVMARNMDYNLFTTITGNESTVLNNFSRFISDFLTGNHSIYGSNVFLRKTVFDRIGGFDESSLTEDCDLGMKLIRKNCHMRIDYTIKSYEQPALGPRDWWHQRVRWTRGSMGVLRKHLKQSAKERINLKTLNTILLYSLSTGGLLFSVILMGFLGFMLYVNVVPPIILIALVLPLAILFAAESILQLEEGRGSISDILLSIFVRPWIIFAYSLVGVYSVVLEVLDAERDWEENKRI